MKKWLFYILLAIFNQNAFCAQAQGEVKYSAEQQAKINELEKLFKNLRTNIDNYNQNQINQEIEKIKDIFLKTKIDLNTLLNTEWPNLYKGKWKQIYSEPALLMSLRYKQLNELSFWLINNGADINIKPKELDLNPISRAATSRNNELLKYIIKKGGCVNDRNLQTSALYRTLFNSQVDKEILKTLLINGAKFRGDYFFKQALSSDQNILNAKIFDEVLNEIVTEYRNKINNYNNALRKQLLENANLPNVLVDMVQQYSILQYTNDQIIDNIIEIRKMLGELDAQGREVIVNTPPGGLAFEAEAHPAAAAAQPIHAAQQDAAAEPTLDELLDAAQEELDKIKD